MIDGGGTNCLSIQATRAAIQSFIITARREAKAAITAADAAILARGTTEAPIPTPAEMLKGDRKSVV